ncbi:MAG: thrombospondin type 3 repeat-containing protein [Deltaproteobacteria bacterium]|nr:thrombospondin type 3 repeat-containing protein [Deltaproteobacteria bacterium]
MTSRHILLSFELTLAALVSAGLGCRGGETTGSGTRLTGSLPTTLPLTAVAVSGDGVDESRAEITPAATSFSLRLSPGRDYFVDFREDLDGAGPTAGVLVVTRAAERVPFHFPDGDDAVALGELTLEPALGRVLVSTDFSDLLPPVEPEAPILADADGDGVPDVRDRSGNQDGDDAPDAQDAFPWDAGETADLDQDHVGDNADHDDDSDAIPDASDVCPTMADTDQTDTDRDGLGDPCDDDDDGDTTPDVSDNCPLLLNADQLDTDLDGLGDACDLDDDNDGWDDDEDNCKTTPGADLGDRDADGIGDLCDADNDNDLTPDLTDNCPLTVNVDQLDTDTDGAGDLCDADDDGDGVADDFDSLPLDRERFAAYVVRDLTTLVGGSRSLAVGVNFAGVVVGQSTVATGAVRAAAWTRAGTSYSGAIELLALPTAPPDPTAAAFAINDLGQIAGVCEDAAAGRAVAVLWNRVSAVPVALAGSGGWLATAAYGINGSGQVVGVVEEPTGVRHAALWRVDAAGAVSPGPVLLDGLAGEASAAYFIAADGRAVGEADDAAGAPHAVVWQIGADDTVAGPVDLGIPTGFVSAVAFGVNAAGLVVGEAETADAKPHPVLWRPEVGALPLAGAVVEGSATAIDDDGRIVGWTRQTQVTARAWDARFIDPTVAEAIVTGTVPNQAYAAGAGGSAVGLVARPSGERAFVAVPAR